MHPTRNELRYYKRGMDCRFRFVDGQVRNLPLQSQSCHLYQSPSATAACAAASRATGTRNGEQET